MALSPATLPRHELAGLAVRVVESTDPGRIGTAGRVVGETMRTLTVATGAGETRVPKRGTAFEFAIDEAAGAREGPGTASEPAEDGWSAGDDAAYVTVDGDVLLSRPARRTENGVDSKWR